jgi:hypothetical protein
MRTILAAILMTCAAAAQEPTKQQALGAMRKAAEFYWKKVSTEGGYHYDYATDLSYGRSEHSEGPTMVENQREATPVVAMAYLDAFDLTGDRLYLDAARAAARRWCEARCAAAVGTTRSSSIQSSARAMRIVPTDAAPKGSPA